MLTDCRSSPDIDGRDIKSRSETWRSEGREYVKLMTKVSRDRLEGRLRVPIEAFTASNLHISSNTSLILGHKANFLTSDITIQTLISC